MVFIIVSFSRKIYFIANARERCDVLKWHEVNGDPRIYVVELDAFEAHDLHLACFFTCFHRAIVATVSVGTQQNVMMSAIS